MLAFLYSGAIQIPIESWHSNQANGEGRKDMYISDYFVDRKNNFYKLARSISGCIKSGIPGKSTR